MMIRNNIAVISFSFLFEFPDIEGKLLFYKNIYYYAIDIAYRYRPFRFRCTL